MKFTYPKTQNILSGYANFCCIPIYIEKHSGATPSITSEQITDDKHKKNPCMLTKVENVAEMSSVAETYPGGGLKTSDFLHMDEGIFPKQHVVMPVRTYCPFLRVARLNFWLHGLEITKSSCPM